MNKQLLDLFEQHYNEFLSGEQLSGRFQCSRTAIWKQIQSLKKKGYVFEAVPHVGYRLVGRPDKLDVDKLEKLLATERLGRTIHYYEQLDSTQTTAHEWVAKGAEEGTLIVAEAQTKGRGRMGRSWHSPAGTGIWMSMILKPEITLPFASQLTLLTAVALCRAIRKQEQIQIGIKWPNDLLFQGKKVSGILLESSSEDERIRYVVAGIGISANFTEHEFPGELKEKATSLRQITGHRIDRERLIAVFLQEFEQLYSLYQEKGFAPIRSLWEALSITLQQEIKVQTGSALITGTAEAIDEMGALVVRDSSGQKFKLYSGDVEYSVVRGE